MLAAAIGAFFRHLTTGRASSLASPSLPPRARRSPPDSRTALSLPLAAPAPTWPIFLSVLMAVIRAQSGSLARARKAHPPSSPEEVVRLVKEERDEVEKLTTIPADKLADGVVKEITFEVRKRGLSGVLAELDAEETGKRTLTVRPALALLPILQRRDALHQQRLTPLRLDPCRPSGSRTSRWSSRPDSPAARRSSSQSTAARTSASARTRTATCTLPSRTQRGATSFVRPHRRSFPYPRSSP